MYLFWDVLFNMLYFVLIVLLPFATFYYEAEDSDVLDATIKKSRFLSAILYETLVIVFCLILLLALFFSDRPLTHIPVETQSFSLDSLSTISYTRTLGGSPYSLIDQTIDHAMTIPKGTDTTYISYPLSFSVFLLTLFSWMGWWWFAVFCGVGLCALPFDFITVYIFRPHTLAPDEVANIELELSERTQTILELAMDLKKERSLISNTSSSWSAKRQARQRFLKDRMEINRLNQMAFILDRDLAELAACKTIMVAYNPLLPYANLAAGLACTGISVLWLLQIILAILTTPPQTQFLSTYLLWFDSWFPMFGTVSYAMFSLYLCFCTLAGCFKLGLRISFCKIHPIKFGGTYMNSFLFNIGVLLICTAPLVEFCAVAFSGYTVHADINLLYNVQITNVDFFSLFYVQYVFVWIILITCCVTFVWLLIYPRDTPANRESSPSYSGERRQLQRRSRERDRPREPILNRLDTAKKNSKGGGENQEDYDLIRDRDYNNGHNSSNSSSSSDSGVTFVTNDVIEMTESYSPMKGRPPTALAMVSTKAEHKEAGQEEQDCSLEPPYDAIETVPPCDGSSKSSSASSSGSAIPRSLPPVPDSVPPARQTEPINKGFSKFKLAMRNPFNPSDERPKSAHIESFASMYESYYSHPLWSTSRPKSGFHHDLSMFSKGLSPDLNHSKRRGRTSGGKT